YANSELASFYGATVNGPGFQKVMLDPQKRAGLITQGAVLASLGQAERSAPILRGVFVIRRLLCRTIPPPNMNVPKELPAGAPEPKTTRERFEALTSPTTCQGCHKTINGIGFTLEGYDGIGAWRDNENGNPVDTSGSIKLGGVDVSLANGVELATALASSPEVSACMTKQWFRFAYGRLESPADGQVLADLTRQLDASGGNVLSLVAALATSDAFLAPGYAPARVVH